jgi:hypothetical protein
MKPDEPPAISGGEDDGDTWSETSGKTHQATVTTINNHPNDIHRTSLLRI